MSANNNGTDVAHNVQIAVDNKNHLVVAVDVVSTPADQNQLHNMASKAVEELGLKKDKNIELEKNTKEKNIEEKKTEEENIITVLADKGYYCGEELEKCKKCISIQYSPKTKRQFKNGKRRIYKR